MTADTSPDVAEVQTILIVEDEVLIRMMIAAYLRECGFKVVEAANGDEALSVLEHSDLKIDLVFSDLEMPGSVDGFGLAQWLRRNRPEICVILAGTPSRAAGAAAELCKSNPTFSKPYEPQAVLDEIRRLLAERKRRE